MSRELWVLAEIVSKAIPVAEDVDGFITRYEVPVGPIHRAIPILDQHGIPRAPGMPTREPLDFEAIWERYHDLTDTFRLTKEELREVIFGESLAGVLEKESGE